MVTNTGGPGILLADMGETHGLIFPELTPETRAARRTFLPPQAGLANPVDMIASATPAQYARTIELVGAEAHAAFAHRAVRTVIDRVLANAAGPLWLPPGDLATVLQAAGITLAAAEQTTPGEAVATAERLGYPLVAKNISPDVLHKSDVGGVILGLETPAAVASAGVGIGGEPTRTPGVRPQPSKGFDTRGRGDCHGRADASRKIVIRG